jgi:hypothetical protein
LDDVLFVIQKEQVQVRSAIDNQKLRNNIIRHD